MCVRESERERESQGRGRGDEKRHPQSKKRLWVLSSMIYMYKRKGCIDPQRAKKSAPPWSPFQPRFNGQPLHATVTISLLEKKKKRPQSSTRECFVYRTTL